eukprot:TRINITY_DN14967_c0_g1_i1.p1 TRINITY_DN14967_c0_g1~~TRINITY_DN14967_c0_g1_i1.p1  ORF type:complete len:765 (+),score=160.19 TRINITY_DN14967_c0_g1_i1:83-2296(+)
MAAGALTPPENFLTSPNAARRRSYAPPPSLSPSGAGFPRVSSGGHNTRHSSGGHNNDPDEDDTETEFDIKQKEEQTAKLEFAARLREALKSVDQDASGELSITEFRALYKMVFGSSKPIDEKLLERMFGEIDGDGSGSVEPHELLSYLDVGSKEIAIARQNRPRTAKKWCWYAVGCQDVDWEGGGSMSRIEQRGALGLLFYKMLSQIVIIISVGTVFVESLPDFQTRGSSPDTIGRPGNGATEAVAAACVIFFTVELVVYLVCFPYDQLNVFCTLDTWINVASCIPWYIELAAESHELTSALIAFRLTRLIRVLRILRNLNIGKGRFSRIPALGEALKNSMVSLCMLFCLIVITCTLAASFIFYAEQQDATFNFESRRWYRNANSTYNDAGDMTMFQSIPDSMWWALVTVCTVGYGDNYPVTEVGKIVASCTMLWSICMMAYPITILSSVFQTLADEERQVAQARDFCQTFYEGIKIWLDRRGSQGDDPLAGTAGARRSSYASGQNVLDLPEEPARDHNGTLSGLGTANDAGVLSSDALAPVMAALERIQQRLGALEGAVASITARQSSVVMAEGERGSPLTPCQPGVCSSPSASTAPPAAARLGPGMERVSSAPPPQLHEPPAVPTARPSARSVHLGGERAVGPSFGAAAVGGFRPSRGVRPPALGIASTGTTAGRDARPPPPAPDPGPRRSGRPDEATIGARLRRAGAERQELVTFNDGVSPPSGSRLDYIRWDT